MREIKFRAWDNIGKQWLRITGFETAETTVSDGYTLEGIFHDGDFVGNKDIILMQYTGIKDKDGTEIYEGDIVLVTEDPVFGGEEDLTGIVKFYEGAFWIENKKEEKAYPLFNEISEREVIGNIHELLEDTKC